MIIRLPLSQANRAKIAMRYPADLCTAFGDTWIQVQAQGPPLLITLDYIKFLARNGYVGLDQIPRACVVGRSR